MTNDAKQLKAACERLQIMIALNKVQTIEQQCAKKWRNAQITGRI